MSQFRIIRKPSVITDGMFYPFRSFGDAGGLVVYRDSTMAQEYFSVPMGDLCLDTRDRAVNFAGDTTITGFCVPVDSRQPVHEAGRNTFLVLERDDEGGYERVAIFVRGKTKDFIERLREPLTRLTLI